MYALSSVKRAWHVWRTDPVRNIAQICVSAVVGQGVFWVIGNDQIGLAMNPKWRTGLGPAIGKKVAEHLPKTSQVIWTVKALEIITDLSRGPIQAVAYRNGGVTPDAVCTAITPPLWPTIEGCEKLHGAVRFPDRVTSQERDKGGMTQFEQSLANIYGNLFRYAQVVVIVIFSRQIDERMTRPLERTLHKILPW